MDDRYLQEAFGRGVRAVRTQRGLSQERLADVLGVHRTFVGSVERGERNLTLQTIARLSRALQVDPLELLGTPSGEPSAQLRAAASGRDPGATRRGRTRRPAPKRDH